MLASRGRALPATRSARVLARLLQALLGRRKGHETERRAHFLRSRCDELGHPCRVSVSARLAACPRCAQMAEKPLGRFEHAIQRAYGVTALLTDVEQIEVCSRDGSVWAGEVLTFALIGHPPASA